MRSVASHPLPTLEMSQQPAEVIPSLVLSQEQPSTLMQGTPSLSHMGIVLPTKYAVVPDDSHPHKKHWKWHLVPRNPIPLAYLASLLVTVFLFVAPVCNSGNHYAVDQLSPDGNGVSFWVWPARTIRLNDIPRLRYLEMFPSSICWIHTGYP